MATGKCDTTKLNGYTNNQYVVDDDIVKKASNLPKPAFLIDLSELSVGATKIPYLTDQINGYRLNARSTTSNTTSIVTKDGFKCLKTASALNGNVYTTAWGNVSSVLGKFFTKDSTIILFCGFISARKRGGFVSTYDSNRWFGYHGYYENDNQLVGETGIKKWTYPGKTACENIGMFACVVNRSSNKLNKTWDNNAMTTISLNSIFSEWGTSDTFDIGKSAESSYYMREGDLFAGFAFYNKALTTEELTAIFNAKSFT